MGSRQGCSLLPAFLFLLLVTLFFGREERPVREPDGNPRRPPIEEQMPLPGQLPAPEYGIDESGRPQDSQGTAFAISANGLWMTAEHVVRACDRIGLSTGPAQAARVRGVFQSRVSDAAIITDGLPSPEILPLAAHEPVAGADGYHMGFPSGRPAVVHSRLIGPGSAARGPGRTEPVLAWAEVARFPEFDHALGGISGGPTLDAAGTVVGINSAASERRGRVLTTRPDAAINLLHATRLAADRAAPLPIAGVQGALARFQIYADSGAIRPVYCDVTG
ncbi:serine protease [Sphingomonas sp. LaA6.9]|uniref:S1 family peptidase n=1 Tax=Sphingomonas sp. LaA6.9 TaxID=2919914 RepID=UPI001F4FDA95|nr:serine protease [Sphingomonas sp. LaA6.9]MCJ8158106.1 serine protease [Sphingomonas sp. LaA6.9]